MPENIRTFRDLRIWRSAMDSAMKIFVLSKKFPADERFSMTDQIRRSARSVAANIAEAWRKRRYEKAFVSKLNDAESEAAETQTWLEFAVRHKYVNNADALALDNEYEHLLAQIVIMINQPQKWTFPGKPGDENESPLRPFTPSPLRPNTRRRS